MPALSGLLAGAASAPHCVAMCGPLAVFASGLDPAKARGRLARHQLGRGLAYTALGAIAGRSGAALTRFLAPDWVSIGLGVLLAAGMLLAASRLRGSGRSSRGSIVSIGRRPRRSLATRLFAWMPEDPTWIGVISALLPCGALYSALFIAAGAGTAAAGAASMAAFALSSGLGLLAAGAWSARPSENVRRGLAAVMVVGALLVLVRSAAHALAPSVASSCHAEP